MQISCIEPVYEEEGDLNVKDDRRIFIWIEVNCRTVFDRGKRSTEINFETTTSMAINEEFSQLDLGRVAYRALFDRGRGDSLEVSIARLLTLLPNFNEDDLL